MLFHVLPALFSEAIGRLLCVNRSLRSFLTTGNVQEIIWRVLLERLKTVTLARLQLTGLTDAPARIRAEAQRDRASAPPAAGGAEGGSARRPPQSTEFPQFTMVHMLRADAKPQHQRVVRPRARCGARRRRPIDRRQGRPAPTPSGRGLWRYMPSAAARRGGRRPRCA